MHELPAATARGEHPESALVVAGHGDDLDDLELGWSTQQTSSEPQTNVGPCIESNPNAIGGGFPLFLKSSSNNKLSAWLGTTSYEVSGSGWVAETTEPPTATLDFDDNDVVFWKGQTGTAIWYSYNTGTSLVFGGPPVWSKQAKVPGAETNAAPSVAEAIGTADAVAVLAWKNATDDTVWYMDPSLLP